MDIIPQKKTVVRTAAPRPTTGPESKSTTKKPSKNRRKNSFRRRFFRYSLVGLNVLVIGLVAYLALTRSTVSGGVSTRSIDGKVSNPLDELSAADIAVNIARMAGLPEETAIVNLADTVNAELETFSVEGEVAQKPQIITAGIKTMADIEEYKTVKTDTISVLAAKFGVTSDSIRWSNDLTEDELAAGIKILIPPMNGIIYTVRSGDTAERLAQTYRASAEAIIVFNDAELNGLKPGQRIFIPGGKKPAPVYGFFVNYGYNGYDPGWCTYYAANRSGAPGGWGHARTWAVNAARTPGWHVSKVPVPGAIAQTTGTPDGRVGWSWGHVGIVEEVDYRDGQYWIKYSDMNGLAGFNRVGHSGWVPALSKYQNFIYRTQ